MSTTPVSPNAVIVERRQTVTSDIAWLRTHVLLTLATLAIVAGIVLASLYIVNGIIERRAAAEAVADKTGLTSITAQQNALLAQYAADTKATALQDAQQIATLNKLIQTMAQQRAATAKQVTADNSLDAEDTAARLETQTKMPHSTVVINDSITLTLPLARAVVGDLDLLTQAQSDVLNLSSQLVAQQTLTADANLKLADASKVASGYPTLLAAQIKTDDALCEVRVAKARKHSMWYMVGAFVGGVVLGSRL